MGKSLPPAEPGGGPQTHRYVRDGRILKLTLAQQLPPQAQSG
jgi:hypothetical protein